MLWPCSWNPESDGGVRGAHLSVAAAMHNGSHWTSRHVEIADLRCFGDRVVDRYTHRDFPELIRVRKCVEHRKGRPTGRLPPSACATRAKPAGITVNTSSWLVVRR